MGNANPELKNYYMFKSNVISNRKNCKLMAVVTNVGLIASLLIESDSGCDSVVVQGLVVDFSYHRKSTKRGITKY